MVRTSLRADPPGSAAVGDPSAEWLEPDGLGGFASGTVSGERRRRYHGLLTVALTPPVRRTVLIGGYDASIASSSQTAPEFLTVQRYQPNVASRDSSHVVSFRIDPWPTWTYRLANGTEIEHDLFVPRDHAMVVLRWRLLTGPAGARLVV